MKSTCIHAIVLALILTVLFEIGTLCFEETTNDSQGSWTGRRGDEEPLIISSFFVVIKLNFKISN